MARSPLDDLARAATDAAYVSVGLGVIAFQRWQVRRHEVTRTLTRQTGEARNVLDSLVGQRVKMLEERLAAALEHR